MANPESRPFAYIVHREIEHRKDGDVSYSDVYTNSPEKVEEYADHLNNVHGANIVVKHASRNRNSSTFGFSGYWNSSYIPKGPPINWREEPAPGDPRNN